MGECKPRMDILEKVENLNPKHHIPPLMSKVNLKRSQKYYQEHTPVKSFKQSPKKSTPV